MAYYYRVKTTESVFDQIRRFSERESGYPVNKVLNDIFGVRIIADSALMEEIHAALDEWVSTKGLKKLERSGKKRLYRNACVFQSKK
ncbi:TPA: hypothetical protein ACQUJM_002077 [Neisseria polysaccharea]